MDGQKDRWLDAVIRMFFNPQGDPGPDGYGGDGGLNGNPVRFLRKIVLLFLSKRSCFHEEQ